MKNKNEREYFMAKGSSATDVYYVNHDKRKEMEAAIKKTGPSVSKELDYAYYSSIE